VERSGRKGWKEDTHNRGSESRRSRPRRRRSTSSPSHMAIRLQLRSSPGSDGTRLVSLGVCDSSRSGPDPIVSMCHPLPRPEPECSRNEPTCSLWTRWARSTLDSAPRRPLASSLMACMSSRMGSTTCGSDNRLAETPATRDFVSLGTSVLVSRSLTEEKLHEF